jgi:hypothetical protein
MCNGKRRSRSEENTNEYIERTPFCTLRLIVPVKNFLQKNTVCTMKTNYITFTANKITAYIPRNIYKIRSQKLVWVRNIMEPPSTGWAWISVIYRLMQSGKNLYEHIYRPLLWFMPAPQDKKLPSYVLYKNIPETKFYLNDTQVVHNCLLECTAVSNNCRPKFQRCVLPPSTGTIILHGSTSQKTILNIILAAVRTWNLRYTGW